MKTALSNQGGFLVPLKPKGVYHMEDWKERLKAKYAQISAYPNLHPHQNRARSAHLHF